MYCTKCGHKIVGNAAFCPACGNALSGSKAQSTESTGSVLTSPIMGAKRLKIAIVAGITLIVVIVILIVNNNNSPLVGRWVDGFGTTIEFFSDGRVIYQNNIIGTWSSSRGRAVIDFPGGHHDRLGIARSGIWQYSRFSSDSSGPWAGRHVLWRSEWGSLTVITNIRPDFMFIRQ